MSAKIISRIAIAAVSILQVCIVLSCLTALPDASSACTNGYFSYGGKTIIGRNMDWEQPDGYVVINARGVKRHALTLPADIRAEWDTKYGYVSFELTQKMPKGGLLSVPAGGMNEKGLYIAALWAPDTKYTAQSPDDKRKEITVGEVAAFALAQYATVQEAVDGINSVQVEAFNTGTRDVNLHWFIADSSGATAYVEFLDGKAVAHSSPQPAAMTNKTYAEERAYIKDYAGFGGSKAIPADMDHEHIKTLDRFLVIANRVKETGSGNRPLDVDEVFSALYAARHTPPRDIKQVTSESATQWTEVYDYSTKTLYWKSYTTPGIKSLKLDSINFADSGTKRFINIHAPGEGDMADNLSILY
jgi:choloylglycine hydrolase